MKEISIIIVNYNTGKLLYDCLDSIRRRVDAAFAELLAGTAGEIVAVVTHGGPAMRILATLHHLPAERQHELLPPRGSITVLNFHQGVFQP